MCSPGFGSSILTTKGTKIGKEIKMDFDALSNRVIGCAIKVHRLKRQVLGWQSPEFDGTGGFYCICAHSARILPMWLSDGA